MSKKAFYITLGLLAIIMLTLLVLGACTVQKSEEEIAEIDRVIVEQETHEKETTKETTVETTEETTEVHTTPSAEELASWVIEDGINGEAREAELGDRYEEVQKWIDENYVPPTQAYADYSTGNSYPTGDVLTPSAGVNYFGGIMETYYCLDMTGVVQIMRSMGYDEASYPYWVRGDGVKMFGDFVMVAADFGQFPRGSIVQTSLGTGIVCDTGSGGWNWFDIATDWG